MDAGEKRYWAEYGVSVTALGFGPYVAWESASNTGHVVGVLIAIAGLLGLLYTLREASAAEHQDRKRNALVLSLVLLTWAGIGYDLYDRHYGSRPQVEVTEAEPGHTGRIDGLFVGWGGGDAQCQVIIDGRKLMAWRAQYAAALVCGMVDAAIDRSSEKRISVSSLYTIQQADMVMVVPYGGALLAALNATKSKSTPPPGLPPDAKAMVSFPAWNIVILLPKNSNPLSITCLDDVPRYGGLIVEASALSAQAG